MEREDIINAINIVDFIGQYVDLEQKGEEFWGLSPFKEEKTPSFSVREETGSFYDFSSGVGGNIITFVRYYFKLNYQEAIAFLEKYITNLDTAPLGREKLTSTRICERFRGENKPLKQSSHQKISKDCMNLYEKREDKLQVWENEGISTEILDKFNVRYDPFSDRLVYPIKNSCGEIVNVGGRSLDPLWKEKGLRKYTYFYKWGTLNVLYALYENMESILSSKEIVIFEGAKSVYLANTWGFDNCVAILTSHLNTEQLKLLVGLGCNVVFALDKDIDVLRDRNIQKLKQYVNTRYIKDKDNLLSDKDSPVDKGKEVFFKLYNEYQYEI